MQLDELDYELGQLGTSLANEDMSVTIEDRVINLMLDTAKEYLYAYGALGKVGTGTDSVTLQSLLALNVMGKKTDGGHLGIVEGGEVLLYSKRFRIERLEVGSLADELKTMERTFGKLSNQTGRILEKAVEEVEPPSSEYDALSVTTAISYGWIQA